MSTSKAQEAVNLVTEGCNKWLELLDNIEEFLDSTDEALDRLDKAVTEAEKKHERV
jgi:hypothetical protein